MKPLPCAHPLQNLDSLVGTDCLTVTGKVLEKNQIQVKTLLGKQVITLNLLAV